VTVGKNPPRFRGFKRQNAGTATAAELVGAVMERLGGKQRSLEQRVFTAWDESVGEVFGRKCRPEVIKGTTLFVRVSSSPIAHELTLLKYEILERLTANLGEKLIEDFRTRVGDVE